MDDQATVQMSETAREKLRSLVGRIEALETERREIADQIKDIYAEAKACGYDTKALREAVKLRGTDKSEREEAEAILDIYLMALGVI